MININSSRNNIGFGNKYDVVCLINNEELHKYNEKQQIKYKKAEQDLWSEQDLYDRFEDFLKEVPECDDKKNKRLEKIFENQKLLRQNTVKSILKLAGINVENAPTDYYVDTMIFRDKSQDKISADLLVNMDEYIEKYKNYIRFNVASKKEQKIYFNTLELVKKFVSSKTEEPEVKVTWNLLTGKEATICNNIQEIKNIVLTETKKDKKRDLLVKVLNIAQDNIPYAQAQKNNPKLPKILVLRGTANDKELHYSNYKFLNSFKNLGKYLKNPQNCIKSMVKKEIVRI